MEYEADLSRGIADSRRGLQVAADRICEASESWCVTAPSNGALHGAVRDYSSEASQRGTRTCIVSVLGCVSFRYWEQKSGGADLRFCRLVEAVLFRLLSDAGRTANSRRHRLYRRASRHHVPRPETPYSCISRLPSSTLQP